MTSTALATRPAELMLAGPLGSLDHYIQAANAIPVLSADEEFALATRLRGSRGRLTYEKHREIACGRWSVTLPSAGKLLPPPSPLPHRQRSRSPRRTGLYRGHVYSNGKMVSGGLGTGRIKRTHTVTCVTLPPRHPAARRAVFAVLARGARSLRRLRERNND